MSALRVRLNGEMRELPTGQRLGDLLRDLGRDPRTVAVERNGRIVPRDALERTPLADGDVLEIVHFVQGG